MGLYSALSVGVAGLQAQSNALGVISDNISNATTVGYQQSVPNFSELIANSSPDYYSINGGSFAAYSPGGVTGGNSLDIGPGTLTSTSSSTDIAVIGNGFIPVSTSASGGTLMYTLAGSFTQDADGNFVNTAGYYLQGWPLDAQGDLSSGLSGADVASGAGAAALQTVNVQTLAQTPVATTDVTLAANLNASQTVFMGAGVTAGMDINDPSNYGITANDLIVPTSTDSLTRGDGFTITTNTPGATGNGTVSTYTYGGLTYSRDIAASGLPADNGDSGTANPSSVTLAGKNLSFTSGNSTITVNDPSVTAQSIAVGDIVNFSNTGGANGIGTDGFSSGLDGDYYVSGVTPGSGFQITLPTNATPPEPATLSNADSFAITSSGADPTATLTFASIPGGIATGDSITIADGPTIKGASLNGTFTVTNVSGNMVSFVDTGATSTGTGTTAATGATFFDATGNFAAGSTATYNTDIFASGGNILDASSPNQTFLGTTGISGISTQALSFTITTAASGTSTFTYTPASSPNAALGQFNTLDNLATAISDVSGLTARVVNNRLYVGATDADAAVTFANGSTTGTNTTPPLAGIDWVGQLGLANIAAGSDRFNSLSSLATQINDTSGLTATVNNPLGTASLAIDASDSVDTINFADLNYGGTPNTGSPLAELGIVSSYDGALPSGNGTTTGAIGPSYDPAIADASMSTGAVTPQFTIPFTVVDSNGTAHTLDASFLKTSNNNWDVEIYAKTASDVITGAGVPSGQVASGTVSFSGNGSLASISSSLSGPVTIDWADGADSSSVSFDWGTVGGTNGVTQMAGGYTTQTVQQNGIQPSTLSSVAINSNGYVVATYANNTTQNLYKIPLVAVTNPDGLQSVTGNAFVTTADSGTTSFVQAGEAGAGSFQSDALENSNVDLSTQLSNMIIAEQSYQFNSKLLSTTNEMLQDLTQMDQSITV